MADDTAAPWTPGPWHFNSELLRVRTPADPPITICGIHRSSEAIVNGRLIAAAPTQDAALNYVADMTYCGADGEWHFKKGYDPQIVLDALALARGETK